jgi:5'-3' exonuclease
MTKTLLVDGNNLIKIGVHGVKDFFHSGKHIGGVWHFINTLRRFIDTENFDKVVVFWDGDDNSLSRKILYPQYKSNRKTPFDLTKEDSITEQKERVKQYLEELFIRQVLVDNNEADDLIAYYCQISPDEDKTIFSGDRDLTQLISDKVRIYIPDLKKYYKLGDNIKFKDIEIPHYNVKTYKIIAGDKSDNIDGIYFLGEKTFIKLFPEILEKPTSVSDILTRAEMLFAEDKENKVLQNLLTGKTKSGIYGNEFFEINTKIVDLSNPLITEEGKEIVELYCKETLDPEGRGYRNLIRMMMEDGFFKFLPKHDDAWVNFVKPFMKLTRKEKKQFKTKK